MPHCLPHFPFNSFKSCVGEVSSFGFFVCGKNEVEKDFVDVVNNSGNETYFWGIRKQKTRQQRE